MVALLVMNYAMTNAQKIQLTNEFEFKSGLYFSFESFQNNQPDLTWDEVHYDAHANQEKRAIQFKFLYQIDSATKTETELPLENIWGICSEGIPYIRVTIPSRGTSEFTALRTRGRICHYTFDAYVVKKVPMTIYDPNTGKPVLKKDIENKKLVTVEQMMNFEDGKIIEFTLPNFKTWIKEIDEQLTATLETLSEKEATEKLHKTMLIFNDRNPIYISQ